MPPSLLLPVARAMPRFYCEYCEIFLTHSSAHGRRQHSSGRKHIMNVIDYYADFQLQLRETTDGALLPPGAHAPGQPGATQPPACRLAPALTPSHSVPPARVPHAVGMPLPPPLPMPGAGAGMFSLPAPPPLPMPSMPVMAPQQPAGYGYAPPSMRPPMPGMQPGYPPMHMGQQMGAPHYAPPPGPSQPMVPPHGGGGDAQGQSLAAIFGVPQRY